MIAYLKTSTQGVELFYRIDNAVNPKGNVVINHGFAEHLGRYDYVAKRLVEAGYNVLRYDLRGHGQSKGPKGHIDAYTEFLEDADAMLDVMKLNNPELPNYMLGHSMGGLITTLYGIEYSNKLDGQILSGAANGKLPEAKTIKAKGLSLLAKIAPKFQMNNPIDDEICSEPEVVKDYKNDPLVLKSASFNFYNEFLNNATQDVISNINKYDLPVLILHGKEDAIVPVEISENVYDLINSGNKKIVIYPKLFHEIFNEGKKAEILDDIIAWLDAGQMASNNSV